MRALVIALMIMMAATESYAAKITDYPEDTDITEDDLVLSVNDPAGTPANRKVTMANLFKAPTPLRLYNDASPVTDVSGECAFDTNAWGASGRGTGQCYDGTETIYLIGALASDAPSDGQVAKWNTGGTITWENDNNTAGITIADTLVGYSDGANNLTGDADLSWNKTTNILTAAGGFSSGASANPTITFKDSNAADGDINGSVDLNCTDTGSGTEDCDITFKQQTAGVLTAFMTVDADGGIYLSSTDSYSFEGISTETSGGSGGYGMYLYSNDGAANADNDRLGTIGFGGHNGTGVQGSAYIQGYASELWDGSGRGSSILFTVTPNNSNTLANVLRISNNGQLNSLGTAPAASSCGTSPSVSSTATDMGGKVTIGTSASDTCTLTFNGTWANAPSCIVVGEDSAINLAATTSTTVLTITAPAASDFSSDVIMYNCFGQE